MSEDDRCGLAASRADLHNAQNRSTREPGTRFAADVRHGHNLVSEPSSDGLEKRTGKEDRRTTTVYAENTVVAVRKKKSTGGRSQSSDDDILDVEV